MLEKIVVNRDRTECVVFFSTHSVTLSHSEGDVIGLLNDIVFEPIRKKEEEEKESNIRYLASLEDTAVGFEAA